MSYNPKFSNLGLYLGYELQEYEDKYWDHLGTHPPIDIKDARAAKHWLNLNNVSDQNIIVYGESLGTAVAIDLAKDHKFAGVILESPFTSMLKLSRKYYPWIPTGLLLKDKYETDKKISKVFSPILILHGRKDNIVPFEMGEALFKQANKPKYNYFIDNDDHMMDFNEALVNSINQFVKNLN